MSDTIREETPISRAIKAYRGRLPKNLVVGEDERTSNHAILEVKDIKTGRTIEQVGIDLDSNGVASIEKIN